VGSLLRPTAPPTSVGQTGRSDLRRVRKGEGGGAGGSRLGRRPGHGGEAGGLRLCPVGPFGKIHAATAGSGVCVPLQVIDAMACAGRPPARPPSATTATVGRSSDGTRNAPQRTLGASDLILGHARPARVRALEAPPRCGGGVVAANGRRTPRLLPACKAHSKRCRPRDGTDEPGSACQALAWAGPPRGPLRGRTRFSKGIPLESVHRSLPRVLTANGGRRQPAAQASCLQCRPQWRRLAVPTAPSADAPTGTRQFET